jgi:hypothetical protein
LIDMSMRRDVYQRFKIVAFKPEMRLTNRPHPFAKHGMQSLFQTLKEICKKNLHIVSFFS